MDKTKKRRLEKKGWRVGSVDEFLALTPDESAYIELKLAGHSPRSARRDTKVFLRGQKILTSRRN